ncbi:MAG: hypothetical protein KDA68_07805 [Planctomycetaceae bacterium]|nr:hypothetical protein [Planctomycetaceae bacterium]
MDDDGDFVIVWTSYDQDGSGSGIYAQRYNGNGIPQGSEFRVNSTTMGRQDNPAIAMDADGDFVITWDSYGQDGDLYGIYAQRYNASGSPQGSEFRVNSHTTGSQAVPAIGMDADGDFVITWQSYGQDGSVMGIYSQRYNASGVPQGSEFRVNSYTTSHQYPSTVGMDDFGNFIIAWSSYEQDGSGMGTYAQRYNASGTPQGSEFRVNSYTTGNQWVPNIGVDTDGDFVISWVSDGQDGSGEGIYAQRYNASGVTLGGEFRVNTHTADHQRGVWIGIDSVGNFAITWISDGQDGSGFGVYAQRYYASGIPQGGEFQVNSHTTNNQLVSIIGMDADGDFVIAWTSDGQDGSGNGVYARRYVVHQNDAPRMATGLFPRLPDWWRKAKTNPGDTVENVIHSVSPEVLITDLNTEALQGFCVMDATNLNGTWQYSLDAGMTWNSLANSSSSSARLLDPSAKLRFVPYKKKFRGDVGLTVTAWDQTTGSDGDQVDATTRGGTTAFSSDSTEVRLTVLKKKPKKRNQ